MDLVQSAANTTFQIRDGTESTEEAVPTDQAGAKRNQQPG